MRTLFQLTARGGRFSEFPNLAGALNCIVNETEELNLITREGEIILLSQGFDLNNIQNIYDSQRLFEARLKGELC